MYIHTVASLLVGVNKVNLSKIYSQYLPVLVICVYEKCNMRLDLSLLD